MHTVIACVLVLLSLGGAGLSQPLPAADIGPVEILPDIPVPEGTFAVFKLHVNAFYWTADETVVKTDSFLLWILGRVDLADVQFLYCLAVRVAAPFPALVTTPAWLLAPAYLAHNATPWAQTMAGR